MNAKWMVLSFFAFSLVWLYIYSKQLLFISFFNLKSLSSGRWYKAVRKFLIFIPLLFEDRLMISLGTRRGLHEFLLWENQDIRLTKNKNLAIQSICILVVHSYFSFTFSFHKYKLLCTIFMLYFCYKVCIMRLVLVNNTIRKHWKKRPCEEQV